MTNPKPTPLSPAAQAVHAAVAEALGGGAYDCTRVWEAWQVGTMGPDDFVLVAEDDDRVAEIADAAIEAICPATLPTPEAGSAAALAMWLRSHSGQCVELGRPDWARMADRAADTLEAFRLGGWIVPAVETALPAPAPVVAPVALSQRLPDPRPESDGGDCDEEGMCWFFTPRSATPSPNWILLWRGHMGASCHSHWLPASAIPAPSNYIRDQKSIRPDSRSLPQAGEVEA
jgi:hypothetical protein